MNFDASRNRAAGNVCRHGSGQACPGGHSQLLERAAQVQIYAMWTGQPLKQLPAAVVEKTKRDIGGATFYDGPSPAQRHFDALKRILDRTEPDLSLMLQDSGRASLPASRGAGRLGRSLALPGSRRAI